MSSIISLGMLGDLLKEERKLYQVCCIVRVQLCKVGVVFTMTTNQKPLTNQCDIMQSRCEAACEVLRTKFPATSFQMPKVC